jgi:salicylate hydroxylase
MISQHSDDVLIDVYEAKTEISEMGTAIAIWKRSWQVLQDLGLDEVLAKRNIPPPKDGEGKFSFDSLPY